MSMLRSGTTAKAEEYDVDDFIWYVVDGVISCT